MKPRGKRRNRFFIIYFSNAELKKLLVFKSKRAAVLKKLSC